MKRKCNTLTCPLSYDIDRMLYIRELTEENNELRRENEYLTKLLATRFDVKISQLDAADKHTYAELRRRLENAACDLLMFISHGEDLPGAGGDQKGDDRLGGK